MTSDAAPADPLAQLSRPQAALLRIACWVAWADGDFAEEERQLLERVLARLLPPEAEAGMAVSSLSAEVLQPVALERLVADLDGSDGRQEAVRLAVQMMGANQRPEDASAINPAEKGAYRQLLDALALPDEEVQQAEWAARQDLARPRSLGELLSETLARFGAWPSLDDAPLPAGYWL